MIDEKYKYPEIITYDSGVEGKTFTVLGAVHGNEPCGPEAIHRIIQLIEDGKIEITKGKMVVMPAVNPLAYEKNVRFVERNLNRFLYVKDNPEHYEDYLDHVLCPVLVKTDYLLDLHSYTSKGDAFVILGRRDQESINYARAMGVPRIIYGWTDVMTANDDVVDKRQPIGTGEYVRNRGKVAHTLECGTHNHAFAADVGFNAILNALRYLEMADFSDDLFITNIPESEPYEIKMGGMFVKTRQGDFTKDWTNMHPVKAGEVIARYDDGEELSLPVDGFIILPHRATPLNEGWFFWGVPEEL